MTTAPAPDELLNLISCGCSKGCLSACSCHKADMLLKSQSLFINLKFISYLYSVVPGLKCSHMCFGCMGISCPNAGVQAAAVEENDELTDFLMNMDKDSEDEEQRDLDDPGPQLSDDE